MAADFLTFFSMQLLKLRYRIRVKGLDAVLQKGRTGILFLPNHPALIDPPILGSLLIREVHPWILVSSDQVKSTILKWLLKPLRLLPLPDLGLIGRAGKEAVQKQLQACQDKLRQQENVLLYPSGHVYRSRYENLHSNGGAFALVSQTPEVRVVLVRTTGLWGSSFSRSRGFQRPFAVQLHHNLKYLLLNLLFFTPRRTVTITFAEPGAALPRNGSKAEFNQYLELFYNADAPGNTYVPYLWWERGDTRLLAEPETAGKTGGAGIGSSR